MLYNLTIQNFILIDEAHVDFCSGFNIITGETGAGKSILLDAILFCLGGRFDDSVIRQGAEFANVSVEFSPHKPAAEVARACGIDLEDDENIIINRRQSISGQKRYRINNQPATQKVIESIAKLLVEMHGQHAYASLLREASHMSALDKYADLKDIGKSISNQYKVWQSKKRELEELNAMEDDREKEADFLEFVVDELKKASVEVGEEDKLADLRTNLQQRSKHIELLNNVLTNIQDRNMSEKLAHAQKTLVRSNSGDKFDGILKLLESAEHNISSAAQLIESEINSYNNEDNLETIEERLFFIRQLARKYQVAADQLSEYLIDAEQKLQQLQQIKSSSEKLVTMCIQEERRYVEMAAQLSEMRKSAALNLERDISLELQTVEMKGCVFKVEVDDVASPSQSGINNVRFMASTNPGTPVGAISDIASGGELSRFMLALQIVLHNTEQKISIIFDEVDVGIGGKVADAVGDRLKVLSNYMQVITITHQPQVASKAEQHIFVRKKQSAESTVSEVTLLSYDERLNEIARMISGKSITTASIIAAKELLET